MGGRGQRLRRRVSPRSAAKIVANIGIVTALTRTLFAGAGEVCKDTQDGHDRIDETLYISPERKWIDGANNRVQRDAQQANDPPSSTSFHLNHPVYPCKFSLFGKPGKREPDCAMAPSGWEC